MLPPVSSEFSLFNESKHPRDEKGQWAEKEHVTTAKEQLRKGELKVQRESQPFASHATGRQIRRYVELPNKARIHPDELHRAKVKDGEVYVSPNERLTVNGHPAKSFAIAMALAATYRGPVTIQGPHGYSATLPGAKWRELAKDYEGQTFAEWHDSHEPEALKQLEKESETDEPLVTVGTAQETTDWFGQREGSAGKLFSHGPSGKGRWVTIGAKLGEDGKKHGGSPVYIENGRITKGHPRLTGKHVGQLDKEPPKSSPHHHEKKKILQRLGEEESVDPDKVHPEALKELALSGHVNVHRPKYGPHQVYWTGKPFEEVAPEEESQRKALYQSKAYARAVWAKKARKEGLDPASLHQLAAEVLAHDKEFKGDVSRLLKDTRRIAEKYGQKLGGKSFQEALAKGVFDADSVPHFDEIADAVAREHVDLFAGHEGDEDNRLAELLQAGEPEPMTEDEAYQQAFDVLAEHREQQKQEIEAATEQRRQLVADEVRKQFEPVPFALTEVTKGITDSLRASHEQLAKEMRSLPQKSAPDSTAPLLVKISEALTELLKRQPLPLGATTQKIHADKAGDVDWVETFGPDGKLLKTQRIKREDGRIAEVETVLT